jgi:predicted ATP-binding protein involved in virulence
MKIKSLHIKNYKIFQDFEIDFTNNGEVQNLIVLAGENGSGKSTLLRDVLGHCMKSIQKKDYLEIAPQTFQIGPFILEATETEHLDIITDMLNSIQNDVIQTKKTIQSYIQKLIEKDKIEKEEAYKQINSLLTEIFQHFNLHIQFCGVNTENEILFKNGNDLIKIENLSNGERLLICRTFSLFLGDYRNTVILIDEPESSFHPSWQNRIVKIYELFSQKNNNQIIMSTHSPHILASVRKEQIRLLAKDENKHIIAINNFEGAYGWKVDRILSEILGMNHLRNPEVEEKFEKINALLLKNQYESEEFKTLYSELENDLGYADNDLILIRLEIQRRKHLL